MGKAFTQPDLATDAEGALALIGGQAYDVIFLDVQMPGMDGFELCVKIRETVLNRHTPVVFVSGQGDFIARSRSTLSGGNDLMAKPFLTFERHREAAGAGAARPAARARTAAGTRPGTDGSVVADVCGAGRGGGGSRLPGGGARAPLANTKEFADAFLSRASKHVDALREMWPALPSTSMTRHGKALLADGFLRISSLVSKTDTEIFHPAYQMCAAMDDLLRRLIRTPGIHATLR